MSNYTDNKKWLVIGDGYIGSAFRDSGISCIGKEEFRFNGHNFGELFPLGIEKYDVIVNALGYTNTTSSELSKNLYDVWNSNVIFVEKLSNYCDINHKKLVHLSTGDLYGNTFHTEKNKEDIGKIDVGTIYRLSKYTGEKFCHENDLIMRIRLPFDGRNHPKNLLVKTSKFTKFYSYVNDYTYVPDLVESTRILVNMDKNGIFNVVSHEDGSVLYLLRNVLQLPHLQHIDLHDKEEPNIIRELSNMHIHNVSSDYKLREYFIQTPLEDAIKKSWKELTSAQ